MAGKENRSRAASLRDCGHRTVGVFGHVPICNVNLGRMLCTFSCAPKGHFATLMCKQVGAACPDYVVHLRGDVVSPFPSTLSREVSIWLVTQFFRLPSLLW